MLVLLEELISDGAGRSEGTSDEMKVSYNKLEGLEANEMDRRERKWRYDGQILGLLEELMSNGVSMSEGTREEVKVNYIELLRRVRVK